jgi:AcrR family transcriptional regulator
LKKKTDQATEEKILNAAQKLFTQNGYAAVRTRDIAAEAKINLALLNYYFRSKEKLFEIVMLKNLKQFAHGVQLILADKKSSLDDKIRRLADSYIDMLILHPDLPLFILSEMRRSPQKFLPKIESEIGVARAEFEKQVQKEIKTGRMAPIHPLHLIANFIGLTVFPFAAAPMLMKRSNINQKEFERLMLERKKLIPIWIKAIMKTK